MQNACNNKILKTHKLSKFAGMGCTPAPLRSTPWLRLWLSHRQMDAKRS